MQASIVLGVALCFEFSGTFGGSGKGLIQRLLAYVQGLGQILLQLLANGSVCNDKQSGTKNARGDSE